MKIILSILLALSLTARAQPTDRPLPEFKSLALESYQANPKNAVVVMIVISLAAAGYGLWRVLVNYCDKYLPLTNNITNRITLQTSESLAQWASLTTVTSTLPVEILVTNLNAGGFYRALVE